MSTASTGYLLGDSSTGRPWPSQSLLFILSAQGPLRCPSLPKHWAKRSSEACWLHAPCSRHNRRAASFCPEQRECLGTLALLRGISQPVARLISFSLSSRREEDSFLLRGPLKAEKTVALRPRALHTRAIFCLDSLHKFSTALRGFFSFHFPLPLL